MPLRKTLLHAGKTLIAFLLLTQTATAGLPLICAPFDAGNAELLPWDEPSRHLAIDRRYPVKRLTSDMLKLLSADAPTVARMENLRRATVYAGKDRAVANELLKALLDRTQHPAQDARTAALAWFDAGYLIETYRQWGLMMNRDMLQAFDEAHPDFRRKIGALEGENFVARAIAATHEPQMRVAASLMARSRRISPE
jgi:hypothetical protein